VTKTQEQLSHRNHLGFATHSGVKRTSGGGCFSFICALSASRGHADERAIHLLRNALHGAGAYAEFAGNLVDAFTCAQLLLDALFNLAYASRPSVLPASNGPL
jgi:hypothetical protein